VDLREKGMGGRKAVSLMSDVFIYNPVEEESIGWLRWRKYWCRWKTVIHGKVGNYIEDRQGFDIAFPRLHNIMSLSIGSFLGAKKS
jgi:hypothetical protein